MIQLTISFSLWWVIPTAITVALYLWAIKVIIEDRVTFGTCNPYYGIDSLFAFSVASFVSFVAWLVGAICK